MGCQPCPEGLFCNGLGPPVHQPGYWSAGGTDALTTCSGFQVPEFNVELWVGYRIGYPTDVM